MSERAKIAAVLRVGREIWLDPEDALEMADDLVKAGYTRQRQVITTVDELLALPDNTALITNGGTACQIAKYSEDSHYLHFAGSDQSSTLDDVDEHQRATLAALLPATVVVP